MIRNIVSLLFICFSINLFAQINEADSTVQVISYWDKNEKQTYLITSTSIKVENDVDTVENEMITYKVDVEVVDSTANSYTIKWTSYDAVIEGIENEIMKKAIEATSSSEVIFKITELGEFIEILNLEDIKKEYEKAFGVIKESFKDVEGMDLVINAIERSVMTDEIIRGSVGKLINQFHMFHGVKYKLGEEVNAVVKQSNMLGGEPFDAHMTVLLDNIDVENDLYIMRMWQNVDEKQLTDAVFQLLRNVNKELGIEDNDIFEGLPKAINQTRVASQIHGSSGWPIYSIMTTEVVMGNTFKIEEEEIEIL